MKNKEFEATVAIVCMILIAAILCLSLIFYERKENMEKIEIGEYVRTEEGYILENTAKAHKDIIEKIEDYKETFGKIVKHSKNIIDLIEEGDYVNGRKIERVNDYGEHKRADFNLDFDDCDAVYNDDIKTILTKEQYNRNCYRLEK